MSRIDISNKISQRLIIYSALAVMATSIILALLFVGSSHNTPVVKKSFSENFTRTYQVVETDSPEASSNSNWWLNSGAYINVDNKVASTLQNQLASTDPWAIVYNRSNPADSNGGLEPQNVFRYLLRTKWQNYQETCYFMINRNNPSASANKNSSNGIFLVNRFQDKNSIYYAGLRADGWAVVKRMLNGVFYTVKTATVFEGDYTPGGNLIPQNKWIGIRSEIKNLDSKRVQTNIFIDESGIGKWSQVLSATDDGKSYSAAPITNTGYPGIGTDFFDASFKSYKITEL